MAESFVSVFKLDGVPILPPVINDEVRAMVENYRQKAIEIERRIDDRKKLVVKESEQTLPDTNAVDTAPTEDDSLMIKPASEEAETGCSNNTTIENEEWVHTPPPEASEKALSRTSTSGTVVRDGELGSLSTVSDVTPIESSNTLPGNRIPIPTTRLPDVTTSKTDLPSWQTSTRTVTPTSDDSLPWLPLVRSNTYNLEKPTIDLHILTEGPKYSTPIDQAKVGPEECVNVTRDVPKSTLPKTIAHNKGLMQRGIASCDQATVGKEKVAESIVHKVRSQRKPSAGNNNNCSTLSRTSSGNERPKQTVTHVVTAHEQRMKELLIRQEQERLQLEKSFREKTQELVALCAKSLTTKKPAADFAMTKKADLKPASSVSQLSLCDISYDSCTDTDDAAYRTCVANETSEENLPVTSESILNNSLARPIEDMTGASEVAPPLNITTTNDWNGNEQQFVLLPHRMEQLRQHQAATIINACARGYLTRRLLRTDEVQTIKRTIVDIVCFIVNSRTEQIGSTDASVRRSAGKHIAFCLDRLHDIFINYTPAQRLQMIRRDRYLKGKVTLSQG